MNINYYKEMCYKENRLSGQIKNEPKRTQSLPSGLSVIALAKMEALAKEGQNPKLLPCAYCLLPAPPFKLQSNLAGVDFHLPLFFCQRNYSCAHVFQFNDNYLPSARIDYQRIIHISNKLLMRMPIHHQVIHLIIYNTI